MERKDYEYKGFNILNINKKDKMRNEYFNPYGCNIYSCARENTNCEFDITHTNQNEKNR